MVFQRGHLVGAVAEEVGDDAHGGARREDVGAARDVFLEDVVLDGAGELADVRALLFGDGEVEREQDGGGGVDGHRGGDASRAGCRRRGCACLRCCRWRRRPCRPRPRPAGDRRRSPSAWAGRRRRRGRWCRCRAGSGSGGWILRRWRSRRTGAWSRGGRDTSWAGCRGCRDTRRGSRGPGRGSQSARSSWV